MKSRGFTLLEVMIVLVILATLTVLSSQAIQQAVKNKVKLQEQIDDSSQVRDALKVMERDVNLAFHYSDLELELKDQIKLKRQALCKAPTTTTLQGQSPNPNVASTPGAQPGCANINNPQDPLNMKSETRVDPVTNFIGKEKEMYFATMNASRLSEGIAQADFIKVGYLVQTCKKPGKNAGPAKSCLVRRSANVVEGDITKGGEDVVLLEDISEFKLRYYGKGKQDWTDDWDSVAGDAIAKGRFPDAVEISLTTEKGDSSKKKKISMQIVVPLRFNNNTYQDNQNNVAKQKAAGAGT